MTTERVEKIRTLLEAAFAPSHLLIKDQSHLHAGHAGAKDGRGHFQVHILADAFADMNRVQCHRAIYAALGDLMDTDIHALSITAGSDRDNPTHTRNHQGESR